MASPAPGYTAFRGYHKQGKTEECYKLPFGTRESVQITQAQTQRQAGAELDRKAIENQRSPAPPLSEPLGP